MKCPQCRARDIELLTSWERFKNWLFYGLFPQDIIDLSQDKYTQGFGDGYEIGRKHQREINDLNKGVDIINRVQKMVEESTI